MLLLHLFRQGFEYQDAVGESLLEVMRVTPGGVLVSV
jgi:hypothetical protein